MLDKREHGVHIEKLTEGNSPWSKQEMTPRPEGI
jgi:hypothetical protein